MEINWHPEASSEFDADIDWYDGRETGLGGRFESDVLSAVNEVADMPAAWPIRPGWDREPIVRARGVKDFPYRVVYFVHDSHLMVVAVAHAKRRPGYWRQRLTPS